MGPLLSAVGITLGESLGRRVGLRIASEAGGGCINQAYCAHSPLDSGYRVRKTRYNLYHVINHANLFGGGYAAQAERMTDVLLAEV